MKKILVVAAHPDDDILGCGGLIDKYTKLGSSVRVIFIAEGTTCRFEKTNTEVAQTEIAKRTSYGIDALKFIGVSSNTFYDLPCGQLDTIPQLKINKIIEEEIKFFKPTTVLTHSSGDANSDHRCVYNSVLTATRPVGPHIVGSVLTFEVLSSSEWSFSGSFRPNYYESLSQENVDQKALAMECYISETKDYPHPRSSKAIKNKAMVRGAQVGIEFAEAFQVLRWINR